MDRVALCDGYGPLQTRLIKQFPDFTLILDFIHADEYLWDVANALLGKQNLQRLQWMTDYTLKILSGQTAAIIVPLFSKWLKISNTLSSNTAN